ncbi:U3 small nucleolar RNA-interacting protein 2-like isoform X2 [Littorina saxatilis]|uniref:U3 small nucleolar RNA-interacting protein 2 n=1 Tax=Littorina saxatilis TaxID=31220 RepID=A0AAN9BAE3_9CAEN
MSFFLRGKGKKTEQNGIKRKKLPVQDEERGGKGKRRRQAKLDEEIESDEEIDSDEAVGAKNGVSSDEEDVETAQEVKLRKAKEYLAKLKEEEEQKEEVDDVTHDSISHRLQQDDLAQSGKLHKLVSDQYTCPDPASIRALRGHQLPVTCAVVSPDSKTAFSASKDGSIIKWCLQSDKKLHIIPGGRKGTEKTHLGHTGCVLCMAITSDGKFLATGDANKLIHIWDPASFRKIKTFTGHRQEVSGLAFRKNSHQLFSAGFDRLVKVWDLDEMTFVENLFGHEGSITAIDSLIRERAVTVGRDRLVFIFKVPEETAVKFVKHIHSDCVALINESNFITGGEENTLCLWSVMKKKPVFTFKNAHTGSVEGKTTSPMGENWITAVASLQFTDLIASGSKDGFVRLWKCSSDFRTLTPLFAIPLPGFVNSLQFSPNGDFLVAAVGQEHRLGRWWRLKQAKNAVYVIPLPKKTPTAETLPG